MTIVAGSLIFRPNRCVRIGRSCGRVLARPGQLRPLHPRTCGLSVEPQEQVSGFKEDRSVLGAFFIFNDRAPQKSMPSMPPPGPPGIAGLCFFGSSATMASVVMSKPATDAAPYRAARPTLAGSMIRVALILP